MKLNIYQKLHKAACEAGGVAKGKKVQGMMFNPLLHDDVQKVAMEALLNNGLYPVCTYTNHINENFVMVTCSMRIHDIEEPDSYVDINGCSAMGQLDKFGTGNGMSYAKKYAFLNALNLKTGLDNDDGYKVDKAEPFKVNSKLTNKIPKSNWKKNIKLDMELDMGQIQNEIEKINDIYRLRKWKKDNLDLFDSNNKSLREYRHINNVYDNHETKLNQQGVI